MKDILLHKLISALAYLSSRDLDNDENLRYLYGQICVIQGLILQYAVENGFKRIDIFAEIQKELGSKK